jgi:hypothetical protein
MSLAPKDIEPYVKNIVHATPAFDPWTLCVYDDQENRIDRLLTHRGLLQQLVHVCGPVPEDLAMSVVADKVWEELFLNRSPISEHCRVVLSTLNRLNLRDRLRRRDLAGVRQFVENMSVEKWWAALMAAANLNGIGVAHDQEMPEGVPHRRWVRLGAAAEREAVLAADYVVLELGEEPPEPLEPALVWCAERSHMVLCEVVSSEGVAQLEGCLQRHPQLRWVLSSSQHQLYADLAQLAERHAGVRLAGCWRPDIHQAYEITRTNLDRHGVAFIHGYSKAEVPEHLVGRWVHMRSVLANVLVEKYKVMIYSGWSVSREDIDRDVQHLLNG